MPPNSTRRRSTAWKAERPAPSAPHPACSCDAPGSERACRSRADARRRRGRPRSAWIPWPFSPRSSAPWRVITPLRSSCTSHPAEEMRHRGLLRGGIGEEIHRCARHGVRRAGSSRLGRSSSRDRAGCPAGIGSARARRNGVAQAIAVLGMLRAALGLGDALAELAIWDGLPGPRACPESATPPRARRGLCALWPGDGEGAGWGAGACGGSGAEGAA